MGLVGGLAGLALRGAVDSDSMGDGGQGVRLDRPPAVSKQGGAFGPTVVPTEPPFLFPCRADLPELAFARPIDGYLQRPMEKPW